MTFLPAGCLQVGFVHKLKVRQAVFSKPFPNQ